MGTSQAVNTQAEAQQASSRGRWWKRGAAAGAGVAGLAMLSSIALSDEAEHGLHSPEYPWPHNGFFRLVKGMAAMLMCVRAVTLSRAG